MLALRSARNMKSTVQIFFLIFLCMSRGFHCREEERSVFKSAKNLAEDIYYSDYFCYGWKVAAASTALIGGIPLAVGALGFGAGGIAAGTVAATYQATLGGTVLAGSAFSALQSIGAVGLATTTKAAIVGVSGAVIGAVFGNKCSGNVDDDGKCRS